MASLGQQHWICQNEIIFVEALYTMHTIGKRAKCWWLKKDFKQTLWWYILSLSLSFTLCLTPAIYDIVIRLNNKVLSTLSQPRLLICSLLRNRSHIWKWNFIFHIWWRWWSGEHLNSKKNFHPVRVHQPIPFFLKVKNSSSSTMWLTMVLIRSDAHSNTLYADWRALWNGLTLESFVQGVDESHEQGNLSKLTISQFVIHKWVGSSNWMILDITLRMPSPLTNSGVLTVYGHICASKYFTPCNCNFVYSMRVLCSEHTGSDRKTPAKTKMCSIEFTLATITTTKTMLVQKMDERDRTLAQSQCGRYVWDSEWSEQFKRITQKYVYYEKQKVNNNNTGGSQRNEMKYKE